jgi:hypothetical protein
LAHRCAASCSPHSVSPGCRTARAPESSSTKRITTCATRPAGGRSQAIALEAGRGRVVVGGEMGVLFDYSVRDADNRRFALNIVRWLAQER